MQYTPHMPTAPLNTAVEIMFHLRGYEPEHAIERLIPDGSATLVIELDDQERWVADNTTHEPIQTCREAWISGPHERYISISARPNTELLAIRFAPGGLFPLLQQPISDLADKVVLARERIGASIGDLRSALLALPDAASRLQCAESWLLDRMRFDVAAPAGITRAIDAIRSDPTRSAISTFADASGFSRRHFIQLFRKHVGLRPKTLQRVLRFARVLEAVQKSETVSWASISLDCGYFDQAHFIRDFKAFSGLNPTRFLDVRQGRSNFLPSDEL